MDLIDQFSGVQYMSKDCPLIGKVLRTWSRPENDANGDPIDCYWKVIGIQVMPGDILLCMVDASDSSADYEDTVLKTGLNFQLLSNLSGEFGFQIMPMDQDEEEPESEEPVENKIKD